MFCSSSSSSGSSSNHSEAVTPDLEGSIVSGDEHVTMDDVKDEMNGDTHSESDSGDGLVISSNSSGSSSNHSEAVTPDLEDTHSERDSRDGLVIVPHALIPLPSKVLGVVDTCAPESSPHNAAQSCRSVHILLRRSIMHQRMCLNIAEQAVQMLKNEIPVHEQEVTENLEFSLQQSSKKKPSKILRFHMQGGKLEKPKQKFVCRECGSTYGSWGGCNAHIRKTHTLQIYGPCDVCKFETYNQDSYRHHAKRCEGKKIEK